MKSFFKAISFILTIVLIFSCFSFSASAVAIKVDGKISTREWSGAKTTAIFSNASQSANNISFAEMKAVKADANTLYLAFSATNPVTEDDITDCGMKLAVADMGTYNFDVDYMDDFENNDNFDIKYETTSGLENNFFFEFKITFKKTIPDDLQLKVQFKDGSEVFSKEVTLSDFINSVVNPVTDDNTTTENSKVTTSKRTETTKFSASKGDATKFDANANAGDIDTPDANNDETSSELTSESVITTNNVKSKQSKTLKIISSAFAVLLVVGACAILLFAKPKATQDNEKEEKDAAKDSKSIKK